MYNFSLSISICIIYRTRWMPDDFLMKDTPCQVFRHIFDVLRGVNQFFGETGVGAASSSKCSSK